MRKFEKTDAIYGIEGTNQLTNFPLRQNVSLGAEIYKILINLKPTTDTYEKVRRTYECHFCFSYLYVRHCSQCVQDKNSHFPQIILLVSNENSEEDDLPHLGQHHASGSDGRLQHHLLPGQLEV